MAKSALVVDPDVKPVAKPKAVRKATASIAKNKVTKSKEKGKEKGKGKATDAANELSDLNDAFNVCLRLDEPELPTAVPEEKSSYQSFHRTMYRVQKPLTGADLLSRPVQNSGSVAQGYFSLLQDFSAGYPESTDIHCWWCCHPFDGKPVGAPKKVYGVHECFQTIGCFCSFQCACAYSRQSPELRESQPLLNALYHASSFAPTDDTLDSPVKPAGMVAIRPAPPREALKQFGGQMSITEFRQASLIDKSWRLISAPMMPWPMYAEEIMAKQGSTSFTRNGMQRTIEIRKSTEHPGISTPGSSRLPSMFPLNPRKAPSASVSSTRTTIGQLISFA